jgi:hypothetical protein
LNKFETEKALKREKMINENLEWEKRINKHLKSVKMINEDLDLQTDSTNKLSEIDNIEKNFTIEEQIKIMLLPAFLWVA